MFTLFAMDNKFHRKSWRRKALFSRPPPIAPFLQFQNLSCASSLHRLFHCLIVLCLFTSIKGVSVHPPFPAFYFSSQPSNTFWSSSHSARFDCVLNPDSGHSNDVIVRWYKGDDSISLQDNQYRRQLSNGSLLFHSSGASSNPTAQGWYRCSAHVPGLGTIVSRKALLQLPSISYKFDKEPQNLSLALTQHAAFQCVIQSQPDASVTWYKDERPVTPDINHIIYPTGTLEISKIKDSDYGNYYCTQSIHDVTRTSHIAKLVKTDSIRQGIPKFVIKPDSQQVEDGFDLHLHCMANGVDRAGQVPTISWLKDGTSVDLEGRLSLVGTGTLRIQSVQQSDAGTYTCRVTNGYDSKDADAVISVIEPPEFTAKPASKYAHKQEDVTLMCRVKGHPQPKVRWLKNGEHLKGSEYFKVKASGDLQILGLVVADSGLYQCVAQNDGGEILTTAQLVVLEEGEAPPPSFPLALAVRSKQPEDSPQHLPASPKSLRTRIISSRYVTLAWETEKTTGQAATRAPDSVKYHVMWQEVGSERERYSNTSLQEYNIQELKAGTKYLIRVRAYNSHGSSPDEAKLSVTTKLEALVPSSPTNLKVTPLSSSKLEVTWDSPEFPKGQIVHYLIVYYKTGSKEEMAVQVEGKSHILSDLEGHQTYSIQVIAVNQNGRGEATQEVEGLTYSNKPSAPPQNFTIKVASSTHLVMRWEPPPEKDRNGVITGYKIRYRRKKSSNSQNVITAGNRKTYALTELRKNTEYMVRIQALTAKGPGPFTPWTTVRTYLDDMHELTVPPMPAHLYVKAKAKSIVVSWAPPPPHSHVLVTGYDLGYGLEIADVFNIKLDADVHTYTISNVKPLSKYVIAVNAKNSKGPGPKRYESVVTLRKNYEKPSTPMLPPVGLNAHVLSSTTVLLTWADNSLSKSQKINDGRYYIIHYRIHNSRSKFKALNSTNLNCHIDELRPNTEYAFKVKVTKGRRMSDFSMLVINKTEEAAPESEPRDVTPVPVEGDPLAVRLNWQPPAIPNGHITGYLIYYTNLLHTNDDVMWPVETLAGSRLSAVIEQLTPDTTYHFKVQARNDKGFSPKSKTVTYNTNTGRFVSGKGKGNYNNNNNNNNGGGAGFDGGRDGGIGNNFPGGIGNAEDQGGNDSKEGSGSSSGGLSSNDIIIIAACAGGLVFCTVVIVVIIVLCRRCQQQTNSTDKALAKQQAKLLGQNAGADNCGGMKPPDLWMHPNNHLELSKMERSQRSESSVSVATSTLRRDSRGSGEPTDDQGSTLDRKRNSFVGECGYPSSGEERYQAIQARNIIRPKPACVGDDPGMLPPPNGHLRGYPPLDNHGVSTPMRPIYPRTQYNTQYYNAPRVNAGDIPHTCGPSKALSSVSEDERSLGGHVGHGLDSKSLGGSMDESMHSRIGYVKPQPTPISPYKKPTSPMGVKQGQTTPVGTIKSSKSPSMKSGKKGESDMSKSLSTEELTAEMANLEGLMKDLNAITQQEFEC